MCPEVSVGANCTTTVDFTYEGVPFMDIFDFAEGATYLMGMHSDFDSSS